MRLGNLETFSKILQRRNLLELEGGGNFGGEISFILDFDVSRSRFSWSKRNALYTRDDRVKCRSERETSALGGGGGGL